MTRYRICTRCQICGTHLTVAAAEADAQHQCLACQKRKLTFNASPSDLNELVPTDGTVETDARLIRLLADRIELRINSVEDIDEGNLLTNLANSIDDIRSIVSAICSDNVATAETCFSAMDELDEASHRVTELAESFQ